MQYSHDFYTQRVNQLLVYGFLTCGYLNFIIIISDKNFSFKIYISNSFHHINVRENRRDNQELTSHVKGGYVRNMQRFVFL